MEAESMGLLGTELGLWLLFISMNFYAFNLMRIDKRRARRDQWRIPEERLWVAAVFGGGIGAYAGMRLFRHKTKHRNFRIGFPVLAAAETLIAAWLLFAL